MEEHTGKTRRDLMTIGGENYIRETDMKATARPTGKGWIWDEDRQHWCRYRRLTPRECFRLMGVSDAEIDKIESAGISKSQQYKMAGNSIVVSCLSGIFGNLFDATEKEKRTLF